MRVAFVTILVSLSVTSVYATQIAYSEHIKWIDRNTKARAAEALYLFDSNDEVRRTRMLFEMNDGNRSILTQSWVARTGESRIVIVDDGSKWRLEVVKKFPVRADSIPEMFKRIEEARTSQAKPQLTVELKTSTGLLFSAAVPTGDPDDEDDAFDRAVQSSTVANALLRDVPPSMRSVISFMVATFTPGLKYGYAFRPAVDLLRTVLPVSKTARVDVRAPTRPTKGTALTDTKSIEFVSRFRSIANPTAPMEQ
jgi:hypothetical protein